MKRLSRRDLEAIADRVIRAYMKLPEIVDQPVYRIYPEILAEKLLGLKIDYQHLSIDGSILGLTSYGKIGIELPGVDDSGEVYLLDGKTVLIESDLREGIEQNGRRNFTIMHETSHQVLKMLFPQDFCLMIGGERLKSLEKRKCVCYNCLGFDLSLPEC